MTTLTSDTSASSGNASSAGNFRGRALRVALQVDFSDSWLGGLNYFKNLVRSVLELSGADIEFIVLTGTRMDHKLVDGFSVARIVSDPMFDRFSSVWIRRKLYQKYTLSDPILAGLLEHHGVDVLSHSGYLGKASRIPSVAWIPDFQHIHLPDYARRWDIMRRNAEIRRIVAASTRVLVSSQSARQDLLSLAPQALGKASVLRFVGARPTAKNLVSLDELTSRYSIPSSYFYLPNQYWKHKNHLAVIRALAHLKNHGISAPVVSTGKQDDFRNPGHFDLITAKIREFNVAAEYRVLGVIPYSDVSSLMHHAHCVINPSRFEGWSTTVEEAKSAGRPMLLSSIPVHLEQAEAVAEFFDPDDHERLAVLMKRHWERTEGGERADEATLARIHTDRQREFAKAYVAILESALSGELQ
jgi:hypothetical protein